MQKSGRIASSVTLMAVSKAQHPNKIRELYNLGHRYFGENYAQELETKVAALSDLDICWSFIGQIQSNKLKKIVHNVGEIQSVTNMKEAHLINRHSLAMNKFNFPIFICVKIADEQNKKGISISEAESLSSMILKECSNLRVRGIMAIPPPINELEFESNSSVPTCYLQLKQYATKIGDGLLSLGMSNDLDEAIEAGSNIVRIGSALFGQRHYN